MSISVRFLDQQLVGPTRDMALRTFAVHAERGNSPQHVADILALSTEDTVADLGPMPGFTDADMVQVAAEFRAGAANQRIAELLGYV